MTRLLGLLCALLIMVVAAEVVLRPGTAARATRNPAATIPLTHRAAADDARSAQTINRWVTVALTRPVFAPDRRPIPGTVAADPGMPRLSGIIASAGSTIAIFQPAGDAKPVVARSGETVGGWKVTAIAAGLVNLRKENQVIALTPRFNGVLTTPRETKAPISRWEAPAATGLLRARWSNPQLQP
jgi:general secretion pathway protein N